MNNLLDKETFESREDLISSGRLQFWSYENRRYWALDGQKHGIAIFSNRDDVLRSLTWDLRISHYRKNVLTNLSEVHMRTGAVVLIFYI